MARQGHSWPTSFPTMKTLRIALTALAVLAALALMLLTGGLEVAGNGTDYI